MGVDEWEQCTLEELQSGSYNHSGGNPLPHALLQPCMALMLCERRSSGACRWKGGHGRAHRVYGGRIQRAVTETAFHHLLRPLTPSSSSPEGAQEHLQRGRRGAVKWGGGRKGEGASAACEGVQSPKPDSPDSPPPALRLSR